MNNKQKAYIELQTVFPNKEILYKDSIELIHDEEAYIFFSKKDFFYVVKKKDNEHYNVYPYKYREIKYFSLTKKKIEITLSSNTRFNVKHKGISKDSRIKISTFVKSKKKVEKLDKNMAFISICKIIALIYYYSVLNLGLLGSFIAFIITDFGIKIIEERENLKLEEENSLYHEELNRKSILNFDLSSISKKEAQEILTTLDELEHKPLTDLSIAYYKLNKAKILLFVDKREEAIKLIDEIDIELSENLREEVFNLEWAFKID